MYTQESIIQMVPAVAPPDYADSGRRSRGYDYQETWNNRGNVAKLDAFPGDRGASFFNVDFNREQNVMEAIRVSQTQEKTMKPRWPRQFPIDLSKMEGHLAVLPSLLQISAGQLGGMF